MKNESESMVRRIVNSYFGRVFLAAGMAAAIYSCKKECPPCEPKIVEKPVETIVEKCTPPPEPPRVIVKKWEYKKDSYISPDDALKITATLSASDPKLKLQDVLYKVCNPDNECISHLVDVVQPQAEKLQSGSTIDSKVQATQNQIQNGSTVKPAEDNSINVSATIPLSAIKRKGKCERDYNKISGQEYANIEQKYQIVFSGRGIAESSTDFLFIEGGSEYSSFDFFTSGGKELMQASEWREGKPKRAMARGDYELLFSWSGDCAYSGYAFSKGNYEIIVKARSDVPEESKVKAPMNVRFHNGCDGDGFLIDSKKVTREGEEYAFNVKIKSPHYDWFSISYPYDDWKTDLIVEYVEVKNTDFCE